MARRSLPFERLFVAWRPAKHTILEVQVRVEVHLDVRMARVKKQGGLVKDLERSALSSTRCFPDVELLADRVRCHLMIRSRAFACALSESVRLTRD